STGSGARHDRVPGTCEGGTAETCRHSAQVFRDAGQDPHAAAHSRRAYGGGAHARSRIDGGASLDPTQPGRGLMETSTVRNRLNLVIDAAKRSAAARRARNDEAARSYERVLEFAVPLFKQIAQALKVSGYLFSVFTPGGSVKLMSDKSPED